MINKPQKKRRTLVSRRNCPFCAAKTEPDYKDLESLKKHLSDRAGILSGDRASVCSRHQRRVAQAIKRARHLAMMPYVGGL